MGWFIRPPSPNANAIPGPGLAGQLTITERVKGLSRTMPAPPGTAGHRSPRTRHYTGPGLLIPAGTTNRYCNPDERSDPAGFQGIGSVLL